MNEITGASWPYQINDTIIDREELLQFYYKYQALCIERIGRMCSLKPHLLSEYLYKISTCDDVLLQVSRVIGTDINIWSSAFFVKEPSSDKYVGMHQDSPYWQLSSNKVVTAWIAFTDSTIENGCLQFIDKKDNQKSDVFPLDVEDSYENYLLGNKTTVNNDLISYRQNIPNKYLKSFKYNVELSPGEFSIHDINVIHGSDKNTSDKPRIGFAIRYIDSDTFHLRDKTDRCLNVRGVRSKYLLSDRHPKGEFTDENIEAFEISMKSAGGFGNKSY